MGESYLHALLELASSAALFVFAVRCRRMRGLAPNLSANLWWPGAIIVALQDLVHGLVPLLRPVLMVPDSSWEPLTWAWSRTVLVAYLLAGVVFGDAQRALVWLERLSYLGLIVIIPIAFVVATVGDTFPVGAGFVPRILDAGLTLPWAVLFVLTLLPRYRRRVYEFRNGLQGCAIFSILASVEMAFGSYVVYDYQFFEAHILKLLGMVALAVAVDTYGSTSGIRSVAVETDRVYRKISKRSANFE